MVILGVQRVSGRDTIFPFINVIKQQQQDLVLPNLIKSQMETKRFYGADYSRVCGDMSNLNPICGGALVGVQLIHMTKWGEVKFVHKISCCLKVFTGNGNI